MAAVAKIRGMIRIINHPPSKPGLWAQNINKVWKFYNTAVLGRTCEAHVGWIKKSTVKSMTNKQTVSISSLK